MEDRKEKNGGEWLTVPTFGDWDMKGGVPDYSLDFSKIRENRKQNKRDISRASIGNEDDLIPKHTPTSTAAAPISGHHHHHDPINEHHSPTARRSIFSCFNCCVKA